MSQGEIQLVVDRLEAVYNHAIVALHGVSLTIRRGEILALLGANGAGKSTTLKSISNLLQAERGQITRGSIHFEGIDVLRTRPSDLVRHGLVQVLEGRHCFRALNVEENLVTGGLGRGSSRVEIVQDLERVYSIFPGLKAKRRETSGLTSGGEQQMTAIGRALMSRPRLLVLDEPSMGLAPLIIRDIFRKLKSLNESEGLSILLAEQNSTVALQYADRATVLENGVAVLEGAAEVLRNRDDVRAFYLGERTVSDEGSVSADRAVDNPRAFETIA
ncbi:ABC transporter ATP-binding protein [Rhodoblastus sphagnicola]|uniref:ABC transporter ATP-binding protein n=1 Tax=Rhodoblastus sphagnicola TaxID=333368 RepID=A0A2S6NGV2_9HYPH|nr:ABC transporter ATP-binding protein [Rhodoblastus sphagnicola]MBB4200253.1 branched-chain amino acid transport system ATP-binding protein [Rhodoblastus sphagnicola]PPQ33858.1 ABC transporter ATP-binding protein [Rhodoblastus sphagnicola]